jgi:transketolase N-terminal domain/subunit
VGDIVTAGQVLAPGAASDLPTRIRLRAVNMVAAHGFGYLGQALSSADPDVTDWFARRPTT